MSTSAGQHVSAVEAHIEKHLVPQAPALTHAYDNSVAQKIPMIAITPAQGKFLSLLTSLSNSKHVLEIGTLGGYSTIWFAEAVKARGGKVTSIELRPERRDVSLENLKYAGVKVPEEAEVLLGAALDVLPGLQAEIEKGEREPFDFVFVDADWENQWNYFDWGVKLSMGKGSVVYVDNVVARLIEMGAVGEEKRDGTEDVVEMSGNDDRVEAVVIQTTGAKAHDGFLMAVVN